MDIQYNVRIMGINATAAAPAAAASTVAVVNDDRVVVKNTPKRITSFSVSHPLYS